jgi:hypothetical protein
MVCFDACTTEGMLWAGIDIDVDAPQVMTLPGYELAVAQH